MYDEFDEAFWDWIIKVAPPEQLQELYKLTLHDLEIITALRKPGLMHFDGGTLIRCPFVYKADVV